MSIKKELAMAGGFLKFELVLPLGADSGQTKADSEPPPSEMDFEALLAARARPHDGSQLEKGVFFIDTVVGPNTYRDVAVCHVTYVGDGARNRLELWAFNGQYREPGDSNQNVTLVFRKDNSVDPTANSRTFYDTYNAVGYNTFWAASCSKFRY